MAQLLQRAIRSALSSPRMMAEKKAQKTGEWMALVRSVWRALVTDVLMYWEIGLAETLASET